MPFRYRVCTYPATFFFAAMGGPWFPLKIAGQIFAARYVLPSAMAMDGPQNIVLHGLGLESVLLPAGVLLVYAAGSFWLAVWQFRFE